MAYGIDRNAVLSLVHEHLETPNMIKHCLASEAMLRTLTFWSDQK